jgi:hypothetical protein
LAGRSTCPAGANAIGMRTGLDDRGLVDFVAMICRRAGRELSPGSGLRIRRRHPRRRWYPL